ncbi:unnamed protein product [Amoebophrya sp. A25]|nr:unnamed protein product [Amoebophrya sp. A25]|eukprot:GSA25T00018456001.1
MNACLPLYLNEAHFRRVLLQIKPVLGYFFTLDPLGYSGEQLVALYGILGEMLVMRAESSSKSHDTSGGQSSSTRWFGGDFADWLICDFAKLCGGLIPLTLDFLQAKADKAGSKGEDFVDDFNVYRRLRMRANRRRGKQQTSSKTEAQDATSEDNIDSLDLLEAFLAGPKGRTKERLPTMQVLIGWAVAKAAKEGTSEDHIRVESLLAFARDERFRIAFEEELCRRAVGNVYRGSTRKLVTQVLEEFMYGLDAVLCPRVDDYEALQRELKKEDNDDGGSSKKNLGAASSRSEEKAFALYGRYCLGDLSTKEAARVAKLPVPQVTTGLRDATEEFQPRSIACYTRTTGREDETCYTYNAEENTVHTTGKQHTVGHTSSEQKNTDHTSFFDRLMQQEDSKVRKYMRPLMSVLSYAAKTSRGDENRSDGAHQNEKDKNLLKRLMWIQAFQFVWTSDMTRAAESGEYLDTWRVLRNFVNSGAGASFLGQEQSILFSICGPIHERFEQKRKEKLAHTIQTRNSRRIAELMCLSADPHAFLGRLFAACPTRGGDVFQELIAMITGEGDQALSFPLLKFKLFVLLTGRAPHLLVNNMCGGKMGSDIKEDGLSYMLTSSSSCTEMNQTSTSDHLFISISCIEDMASAPAAIAGGTSWVHCQANIAEKFEKILGVDTFSQIELCMRGKAGWVYRESDIPNRHGHCNSHPNKSLFMDFSGFSFRQEGRKKKQK